MASGSRRVEFDRNVQTLGNSWTSSMASTSAGSMASTSTEHYQQRNSSPLSGNSSTSSGSSLPADRQSPFLPGNYQSYHPNDHQAYQSIEYYGEDDDDFDDSCALYINQNGGESSYHDAQLQYEAHSKLGNGALIPHHDSYHSNHPHHHLHPIQSTLYRNGSVSIVNCEYKLKEKYPHLIYLLFFVIIYILLILLGASLFVLFEAKTELRLRDQILLQQQMFLDANTCVDGEHFFWIWISD